jgi:hypothetical protein
LVKNKRTRVHCAVTRTFGPLFAGETAVGLGYHDVVKLYVRKRDREDWWREAETAGSAEAEQPTPQHAPRQEGFSDTSIVPSEEWTMSESDEAGSGAHNDVSLALMLMAGTSPWQRIDGMGMARTALEAVPTGNQWRDLSLDERLALANGRAWCHVVYGDLSPNGTRNDPIVLVDAARHAELAYAINPDEPEVATTLSLLALRQGRVDDALGFAHQAVEAFASLTDRRRGARAHGSSVLAVMTLALATASSGESQVAVALATAARAMRTAVDVDQSAFTSLLEELAALMGGVSNGLEEALTPL